MTILKTRPILSAISLAALCLQLCIASDNKISPDIDLANTHISDVIVKYTVAPNEKHIARAENLGGRHRRSLDLIKAHHFSLSGAAISPLANDPEVMAIHPNRQIQGSLANTAGAVNASAAWTAGYNGSGISVAVIDSGISQNDHNQDVVNVVYAQDFTGSGTTADLFGHGTHVAGIIAGTGIGWQGNYTSTQTNWVGIARGVKIVNLRVLDETGSGTDSNVIAAIQKAVALKSKYNIRVINLSLGRPYSTGYANDPLCDAVEAAWKAGIVVVVAAGNEGRNDTAGNQGYGTITAPGNDPAVITVGAMKSNGTPSRNDDTIASYSSKGPTLIDHIVKPDLVAPGNQVLSAAGWNYGSSTGCNEIWANYSTVSGPLQQFMYLNGTSMATPVVSAAAAILLQQTPTLTPDQVKARLMRTAYKKFPASSTVFAANGASYTSYYDIFTVGAGYLDLGAAVADNNLGKGQALSPVVNLSSNGTVNMTSCNATWNKDNTLSACNAIWGSNVIWGSNTIWGSNVIWGSNAIWGSNNLSASNAVLGTNAIWGSSMLAGSNAIWGSNGVNSTNAIWGSSSTTVAMDASSILINGDK